MWDILPSFGRCWVVSFFSVQNENLMFSIILCLSLFHCLNMFMCLCLHAWISAYARRILIGVGFWSNEIVLWLLWTKTHIYMDSVYHLSLYCVAPVGAKSNFIIQTPLVVWVTVDPSEIQYSWMCKCIFLSSNTLQCFFCLRLLCDYYWVLDQEGNSS